MRTRLNTKIHLDIYIEQLKHKVNTLLLTSAYIGITRSCVRVVTITIVTPVPRSWVGTVSCPVLYPSPTVLDRALGPGTPVGEPAVTGQRCG